MLLTGLSPSVSFLFFAMRLVLMYASPLIQTVVALCSAL